MHLNLFIIHPWKYSECYRQLITVLNQMDDITFSNYSLPKQDNLEIDDETLHKLIESRIKEAQVVLIVIINSEMNNYWIKKEIEIANNHNKRIIAVRINNDIEVPSSGALEVVEMVPRCFERLFSSIIEK